MNAENESLKGLEGRIWIPGAEVLFQAPEEGLTLDPGHFVMTYNFQPVQIRDLGSRGIRELESPLSDY